MRVQWNTRQTKGKVAQDTMMSQRKNMRDIWFHLGGGVREVFQEDMICFFVGEIWIGM
jgi:hypothetical protein